MQAKISDIPTTGVGVKQEGPREKKLKPKQNKKPKGWIAAGKEKEEKSQGDVTSPKPSR